MYVVSICVQKQTLSSIQTKYMLAFKQIELELNFSVAYYFSIS